MRFNLIGTSSYIMGRPGHNPPAATRRRSPRRVHNAITRELALRILSGRAKPGELLEGEVGSSARLRVSRGAYREAVRTLVSKGLVEPRPKTGTRVNSSDKWVMLDPDVLTWMFSDQPCRGNVDSLFELRMMIEPAAAELAASRRKQRHLDVMRNALDAMGKYSLHTEAGRLADHDFHTALLSAAGNPFLASLGNSVRAAAEVLSQFGRGPAPRSASAAAHCLANVYSSIAAKDPRAAHEAMARLIRVSDRSAK